jgi:spore germination cell wall hydrolase CwlJ-like protein
VAIGAYAAGASNLISLITSGSNGSVQLPGFPAVVEAAAIGPFVLPSRPAAAANPAPSATQAPSSDAPSATPPAARGFDMAALFTPSTILPAGSFVRPAAPPSASPAPLTPAVAILTPTVPLPNLAPAPPAKPGSSPSGATAANAQTVLAYASPKDVGNSAPFDAVISNKPSTLILDPKIDANHAWLNAPLPAATHTAAETKCLAQAIYFEARGEPQKTQVAVAQVVLNRVKNPAYPKTICDVVFQNADHLNACQFSFACDGLPETIDEPDAWKTSMDLATKILADDDKSMYLADIGASTHYHDTSVLPEWAGEMQRVEQVGSEIFYKTFGGGWD